MLCHFCCCSVIGDLVSVIERQKSLLTRVEGLESRAQGAMVITSPKDQFNAFAYVSLDELEDSTTAKEEWEEVMKDYHKIPFDERELPDEA